MFIKLVPKVYDNVFLVVGLTTLETFAELVGSLTKVSKRLKHFVIYRKDNFVYHYWGFASIYRPLSYPFRSLSSFASYLKMTGCLYIRM